MKILLVSTGSGSRGGGEIFLRYLAEGLAKRGHQVVVWLPSHPRMDELAAKTAKFVQVVRDDYRSIYDRPLRSVQTSIFSGNTTNFCKTLNKLTVDVVHVNKQNLEDGLDLLQAADICDAPCVTTIHLTQSARYLGARAGLLRDWIARWSLRKFRGIIVTVQDARCMELQRFLGSTAKVRKVLYGVPLAPRISNAEAQNLRSGLGLSKSEFLIIGLGRLVPQKRPLLFLQLATALKHHLPRAQFLWVGDGELLNAWREQVKQNGLEQYVTLVGWQDDVRPYLAAGDLLLHVARYEGFPFAIIEAMAAGLPCAITRELSCEIPLLDETRVLIADDPDLLAAAVMQPGRLPNIAAAARRFAERHLSAEAMAARYEAVYKDAICNHRRAASSTLEQQ